MRDADVAMYRAKADGKGRHAVFDAAMHEQVMRRLDLEGDLRRAIEQRRARGRLPADRAGRDGPDRRLRGARAAGRTASRRRSWRMAEETGLAVPLGRQILDDRLRAARATGATLPRGAGLTVGVNVSGRQLGEPGFVRDAARDPARERARPARAAARGLRARPLARARATTSTRRVLEQALEQARRAHAHRRLRHGRVAAAAAAPLPRRRDQDLARAGEPASATTRARSRSCARSSGWRTTSGSR